MNQQQRKKWNDVIEACQDYALVLDDCYQDAIIAANKYIKQLEKRLNIKEPAALFKEKNESTQ